MLRRIRSRASTRGTGGSRSCSNATSPWSPTASATSRCRGSAGCSSAPTSPTSTPSRGRRCSTRRSCPRPIRPGSAPGEQRFVMSLRAVGEGHISSIEFRTGVVDAAGDADLRSARRRAWSPATARRPRATTRRSSAPSWSSSARGTSSPGRCWSRCRTASRSPSWNSRSRALERDGPAARHQLRDGQDHPRARRVELRHHASRPTRRCPSG